MSPDCDRRLILVLLTGILMSFWASCVPTQDSETLDIGIIPDQPDVVDSQGSRGEILRYPMVGEPSTFNFLAATESRSKLVALMTTGTLLEFDPIRQEVRGGLCLSYQISRDGGIVRLDLREGVRFSDGHPLTSEDVLFTFREIYREDSENVLKEALLIDGRPIEASAESDQQITLKLPRPYAPILYLLTNVPVLPRHLLEDLPGAIEDAWTLDTLPTRMAGLGPFVIREHESGVRTRLMANPHYWKIDSEGLQLPYLEGLEFAYVSDRNTQVLQLLAGELDLIDQLLDPEAVKLVEDERALELIDAGPSANTTLLWFNLTSPRNVGEERRASAWFSDVEFRRSVGCAIDRQAIVRNAFAGAATAATTLVSPALQQWFASGVDPCPETFSPRRALAEAGFQVPSSSDRKLLDPSGIPVEFGLLTRSDEVLGRVAAMIQQDLKELGMVVSLQQEELGGFITRVMGSYDYDLALMNLDFPVEASDMKNVLLSSGSMHLWNPASSSPAVDWEGRIDELMWRLDRVAPPEERFELFSEVQRILAARLPAMPIAHRNVIVAHRDKIRGLDVARVFPYALSRVWTIRKSTEESED